MDALAAKQGAVATAGELAKSTGFDELLVGMQFPAHFIHKR